ncbi:arylsulfatase [Pelagicoccus mobilis]|uniref:Arylsulfatase n=1 Tax=Pelagicoccus mobilis TaxID=415221 RepID=A0A934S1B5_9BACT|nr:arylsulfatase [Pelagicoccus mobilis]MBK1879330.1 arylsulfatase [Pelagicoccus mobilis]
MIRKRLALLFTLHISHFTLSLVAASASKPNIVLIMSDDMGWSDIQPYGGEIETPALQNLADNGLRFTQFYNSARCSPTRAALLTGLYQHQAGMGILAEDPGVAAPADADSGYKRYLNKSCVTIAEALKPAGYHTYMAGKWHLGYHGQEKWPRQRGFDRFYGIVSGASSFHAPRHPRGLTLDNDHLPEPTGEYYTTDAFTDYALEFIDTTPEGEPFFLYLSYTAPHWPLHARDEDIAKFTGRYRSGWDVLRASRWQRQIAAGLVDPSWGLSQRDDGARAWTELTEQQVSELDYRMAVYAAMVHRMDHNIGRVVKHLKDSDQLDNTLLIFLNDNGACAEPYTDLGGGLFSAVNQPRAGGAGGPKNLKGGSSYGTGWANASNVPFRRYKAKLYEGGIATPLIVHWPAGLTTAPGTLTHEKGYLTDMMPTFLEVAGASYPSEYEGNKIKPLYSSSLIPIFKGDSRDTHDWMFWEHYIDRAARKGDWKILGRIGDENWELYNLATDRTESIDLADQHPELVTEMAAAWQEWAESHDVLPNYHGTKDPKH